MTENYKKGGLEHNRHFISKRNGDPVDPDGWYFVLRIDKDPHARVAALAYADSIVSDNPKLSRELYRIVKRYNAIEQALKGGE